MFAILTRTIEENKATRGILWVQGMNVILHTLEEPWLDNKRSISCIPSGRYKVTPHNWENNSSLRFKEAYHVNDVPNRSAILIHSGNTTDDIEGCILVGLRSGILKNKPAVLASLDAMNMLRLHIGRKNFDLIIHDIPK